MNESQNEVSTSPTPQDWQQECADLRKRVNFLLFALLVLSLTFTGLMVLQFRRASRDLEAMRPQASKIVEVNRREAPAIENFITKLAEFSKAHPDFATNLARYNIKLDTTSSVATPPAELSTPPIATPTK